MSEQDKQLCVMTLAFPVDSDDIAIRIKKEIMAIIATVENSRIEFRLSTVPTGIKPPDPDHDA